MKKISILGSTGSIGTQTLEVIKKHKKNFEVVALSAHKNTNLACQQLKEFKPKYFCISRQSNVELIKSTIKNTGLQTKLLFDHEGLIEIAQLKQDLLIVAIFGTTALLPTIEAIKQGCNIGLANKETLVVAGPIIKAACRKHNVSLIPIDSEHAAIQKCIEGKEKKNIKEIILAASGGPFWQKPLSEFSQIRKEDALKHPTWSMGNKISLDSATMMNKALEIIEAHYLFDLPYSQINALIHPQSIIHAMTIFKDGNTLMHASKPDMKLPIQNALFWPETQSFPSQNPFKKEINLTFHPIDLQKFPLIKAAYSVGKLGKSTPIIFNTANDIANQLFLDEKIPFLKIQEIILNSLDHFPIETLSNIDEIILLENEIKEKLLNDYK